MCDSWCDFLLMAIAWELPNIIINIIFSRYKNEYESQQQQTTIVCIYLYTNVCFNENEFFFCSILPLCVPFIEVNDDILESDFKNVFSYKSLSQVNFKL